MVSRRSAADYDSAVDSSEPNVGRYLQESIKSTPSRQRPNPSAISVISLHPVRNQRIAPFQVEKTSRKNIWGHLPVGIISSSSRTLWPTALYSAREGDTRRHATPAVLQSAKSRISIKVPSTLFGSLEVISFTTEGSYFLPAFLL